MKKKRRKEEMIRADRSSTRDDVTSYHRKWKNTEFTCLAVQVSYHFYYSHLLFIPRVYLDFFFRHHAVSLTGYPITAQHNKSRTGQL